jgi:hypothetical protein
MLPKWHLLWGVVLSSILLFTPLPITSIAIIFISSILIDLDHYSRYILITKKFSLKKFWNWSMDRRNRWKKLSPKEKKKYSKPVFILHNIEFLFILTLLSHISQIFFLIFLGILFHLLSDFVHAFYKKHSLSTKFSLIYVLNFNKSKKDFFNHQ